MRTAIVVGLVLATLALVMAASFAISVRRGEHGGRAPGGQRIPVGGKTVSERTSGAPASEGGTHEASVEAMITGSPGLRFVGKIETPDEVRSIEGRVPEAYSVAVGAKSPTPDRVTATV